jgi:hypothetical protein
MMATSDRVEELKGLLEAKEQKLIAKTA